MLRSVDVMDIFVLLRVQTARECPHLPKTSPLPHVSGKSEASSLDGNVVARCCEMFFFRVILGICWLRSVTKAKTLRRKGTLGAHWTGNGCPARVDDMIRKSSC